MCAVVCCIFQRVRQLQERQVFLARESTLRFSSLKWGVRFSLYKKKDEHRLRAFGAGEDGEEEKWGCVRRVLCSLLLTPAQPAVVIDNGTG